MQPIVQQKQGFPEANFLYFRDSLIDIFSPSINEDQWTFSVRHGIKALYEYLDQSMYKYPEEALRAAKLHVLINFCERSDHLNCLTDYSTDCVLTQSEGAIAMFGNARNASAKDFYPNPQDRVEALRNLQLKKRAEHKSHLINLDGRELKGVTLLELIELDSASGFVLELFKPDDVRG